jgi:hypothetical protein
MEVSVSFAVFDITVPVMVHGLNVIDDYLDHAQALERTKAFEPGRILGERLAPRRRRLHPAPGAARLLLPHLDCARDPPAPRSKIGKRAYLGNLTQQSGGDYS